MTKKSTHKRRKPPVGGYGTKSRTLATSITVPDYIYDWVDSMGNRAGIVRDALITYYNSAMKKLKKK